MTFRASLMIIDMIPECLEKGTMFFAIDAYLMAYNWDSFTNVGEITDLGIIISSYAVHLFRHRYYFIWRRSSAFSLVSAYRASIPEQEIAGLYRKHMIVFFTTDADMRSGICVWVKNFISIPML